MGSIPGWDLSTAVVSLGKKLYPHCLSHTQLLNRGSYIVCHVQGSAEKQPLADAAFPVKITEKSLTTQFATNMTGP